MQKSIAVMVNTDALGAGSDVSPNYAEAGGGDNTNVMSPLLSSGTKTSAGDAGYVAQQSYSAYLFTGPFMLGQSLRNNGAGINTSVLLGSLVNLSVLGWMINVVTQRPTPMDPFGPFVAGVAQVGAGIVITPLPSAK